MTITIPANEDSKPTGDWREGLVVLPPDHVYGRTALTQQEWRQLGHKLDDKGVRFVAVYTSLTRGTRTSSQDLKHGEALRLFSDGAKVVGLLSGLVGGVASGLGRVSVHRADEWRKR